MTRKIFNQIKQQNARKEWNHTSSVSKQSVELIWRVVFTCLSSFTTPFIATTDSSNDGDNTSSLTERTE